MCNIFITEHDAAKILCVSPRTLTGWRLADKGPRSYKFCGAVRYSRQDIEDFVGLSGSKEGGS